MDPALFLHACLCRVILSLGTAEAVVVRARARDNPPNKRKAAQFLA